MGMIVCPECGRNISSFSKKCPNCGVPQDIIKLLTARFEREHPGQHLTAISSQNATTGERNTIHCVMCRTSYESDGAAVCPECMYPAFSFNSDFQKTKSEVRAFRKKQGIPPYRLQVGHYYTMGHYGGESINWRVLAIDNGKALLVTEKLLDAKQFDLDDTNFWHSCTLRRWLNSEFIASAFTTDERGKIITRTVPASVHPEYKDAPSKDTMDKVFLLSLQEVEMYFENNEDRRAYPTDYAKANGASVDEDSGAGEWWLRTSGYLSLCTSYIGYSGSLNVLNDFSKKTNYCIRPAIWIYESMANW